MELRSMGASDEGNRKKSAEEAIMALRADVKKLNDQIDFAAVWIGAVPALPSNETRQVIGHILDMSLLFFTDNADAITAELARGQKHLALAMFDTVSVLNRFHFAALDCMVNDARARMDAVANYVLSELDRLKTLQKAITDPPSMQRGNVADTQEDKKTIDRLTLEQKQIALSLEALYRVIERSFGAPFLKEMLEAFRNEPDAALEKKAERETESSR